MGGTDIPLGCATRGVRHLGSGSRTLGQLDIMSQMYHPLPDTSERWMGKLTIPATEVASIVNFRARRVNPALSQPD